MRKLQRRLVICCMIAAFLWCNDMIYEKLKQSECLIRFPVVVYSVSPDDPSIKGKVADSVLANIQQDLSAVSDTSAAKDYLKDIFPKIQHILQTTVSENGCLKTVDSALSEMPEKALSGHREYTVGFYLIDWLSDLEKMFFHAKNTLC